MPFYFGIGDHQAILMYIPLSIIAGKTASTIVSPSIRRLICKNQQANVNYVQMLEKFVSEHKIENKLVYLKTRLQIFGPQENKLLNSIDNILTSCMIHA